MQLTKKTIKAEVFNQKGEVADFVINKGLSIKGCKIVLNFLSESNGDVINTVKKILVSSHYQGVKK